jgi:UDP-GlcNAc:undecaprenyl-phosphate GlcNAc-1-phosphate transferase
VTYAIPLREYALVFATAAAVTYLITGVVRLFAIKIGALTPIRERDVHSVPTPRMGGVAVYIGVAAAILLAYNLPALSAAFTNSTEILGVLVAGGVICFVGVLDDRFDLGAITKLAGQVLASGLLVLFGVQWVLIQIPNSDGSVGSTLLLGREQQVIITVLLSVLLINAMNFIDGLDGLLAGVALISAAASFLFSSHVLSISGNNGLAQPPLIAAALAGACLGFLPHNFFRARIFMGDSGAMFIGLTMAAATTSTAGKIDPSTIGGRSTTIALLAPLIVALAVVFIPVLDFFLAVIRRARAGRSPLSADKQHLHHRMLNLGHTHRQAVLIFYVWALVFAGGAVSLGFFKWQAVLGPWLAGVLVATALSASPRIRAHRLSRRQDQA